MGAKSQVITGISNIDPDSGSGEWENRVNPTQHRDKTIDKSDPGKPAKAPMRRSFSAKGK